MSELAFPLLALGLAAGTTYWFCIRPMRRGDSHCNPQAGGDSTARAELEELRHEVAGLRAAQLQVRATQRPQSTVHIETSKGSRTP